MILKGNARNYKKEIGDDFVSVEHLVLAFPLDKRFGKQLFSNLQLSEKSLKDVVQVVRGSQKVTDQIKMQNDEVIWQVLRHKHCSYMAKITVGIFCRNEYNLTGICNRSSCPLANSRYATICDHDGVFYSYMKTIERAHMPNKLWERVKLPRNYEKTLEIIDKNLMYWPKFLVHKEKQRLTKMTQMCIRMRKLALKTREKIMTSPRKEKKREARREEKAEKAAILDKNIEKELLERLKNGTYDSEIVNARAEAFNKFIEQFEGPEMDVNEEYEVETEFVEGEYEEEDDMEDSNGLPTDSDDEDDDEVAVGRKRGRKDSKYALKKQERDAKKKKGRVLVEELGINKILIVDWDVYHGNGTQKTFYKDSQVLFFSVHRDEYETFYPCGDDGSYDMKGDGEGEGYNINVPWENGKCGDADYIAAWDHILILLQENLNVFKGGLKTPSATQVQQITERLSSFGNIQGKNVFYWFQNRKARERQKLRKKFMNLFQQHHLYPPHHQPGLPLHHVSGLEDASSWKGDLPSAQTCNLMCDCRFVTMMMMDHGGTAPYCTRVPPKTLQLFPVTTTISADLKQDDQSSNL